MPSVVLLTLAATVVVALPVSYHVTYSIPSVALKYAVSFIWWVAFLSAPLYFHADAMPKHYATTMIFAVVSFMFPLKLMQLILFPHPPAPDMDDKSGGRGGRGGDGGGGKKTDDDCYDLDTKGKQPTFLEFTGSFLYYLVSVSYVNRTDSRRVWILRNLEYLVVILCKILTLPILDHYMNTLTEQKETHDKNEEQPLIDVAYVLCYMKIMILFGTSVIASAWVTDLQSVLVNVLSLGRYEALAMHNYPGFSVSVRDFWGRRYNALVHVFLVDTVYRPMLRVYATKDNIKFYASLACFTVSGILHSWVAYFTFGRGVVRALVFFVIQAFWIGAVEVNKSSAFRAKLPWILQVQLSWVFMLCTLPLYLGLFVEAGSDWLTKNPLEGVPRVPVLSDFVARQFGVPLAAEF